MKLAVEHLPKNNDESFVYRYFDYDFFPTPWHYHSEYELVLVVESTGMRYIGDNIKKFTAGDLCFIGSNIPHTYKNHVNYYKQEQNLRAKSIVVHFSKDSFANCLSLPELKPILTWLNKNNNAYEINGLEREKIAKIMIDMQYYSPTKRWYSLLTILDVLCNAQKIIPLINNDVEAHNYTEVSRFNKIFEFVKNNYQNEIKINMLAELIHMTSTSFSRFFIKRTRQSFSDYLLEYRLSKASCMLRETEENISEIARASGFNNMSYFNRQFKKKYNTTPKKYKKALFNPTE